MVQYAWLIPLFPLAAYLILLVMGRKAKEGVVATIAVLSTLVAFIFAVGAANGVAASGSVQPPYLQTWVAFGSNKIQFGYEVTPLDAMMLVVVTFVSTLVFLFSRGYMAADERFSVFYQYLCLFVFSMLGLVISPTLLQTYIFWELVGLCSYLLVGFWYFKPEAASAAKKSFVVTRIGDVGLFIGIILLFVATGSFNYGDIFSALQAHQIQLPWISQGTLLSLCAILIFVGAVGKSAQFPLHVWLPDAMEGPTPVSALIHAATMVAAGVYLVARTFPLFATSSTALQTVAVIGGFTALFAAAIGLTQNDIKRVIAYSTVSQLGYMMLGLGVSAYVASTFHLMTHAFFKALLFLGAGSVIHGTQTQDLREMGGLWKKMPVTAWTFLFGALALSGIFPFAGFWSKDEIINAAFSSGHPVLGIFAVVAAFFTAFYIFRVFFMTFSGEYRGHHHPHESGPVMTIPLVLLAIMALFSGFVNVPFFGNGLEKFLTLGGDVGVSYSTSFGVMGISLVVGLLGIFLAYTLYVKQSVQPERVSKGFGPLYKLSFNKFYIDELYHRIIVVPVNWIAKAFNFIDRWIIDGIVYLVGQISYVSSLGLKYGQNGQVQTYGLLTLAGLTVIVAVTLFVGGIL